LREVDDASLHLIKRLLEKGPLGSVGGTLAELTQRALRDIVGMLEGGGSG
jgi:hypothetical protein